MLRAHRRVPVGRQPLCPLPRRGVQSPQRWQGHRPSSSRRKAAGQIRHRHVVITIGVPESRPGSSSSPSVPPHLAKDALQHSDGQIRARVGTVTFPCFSACLNLILASADDFRHPGDPSPRTRFHCSVRSSPCRSSLLCPLRPDSPVGDYSGANARIQPSDASSNTCITGSPMSIGGRGSSPRSRAPAPGRCRSGESRAGPDTVPRRSRPSPRGGPDRRSRIRQSRGSR